MAKYFNLFAKHVLKYLFIIGFCQFTSAQPIERFFKINTDTLKKIDQDLKNDEYGKISSIVIISKSKIIFEHYYGFSNSSSLHPISSVTKSITSLITGICIDKGYLKSIDEPIWPFFPEYKVIFDRDTLKKKITIRNLLNQTTGLEWDEWTKHYSYAGNALIELSQSNQNWVESTLNLKVESEPNTKFSYNSGNSQVIEEILCKVTGQDFESLVKSYLFEPIGITTYHWDKYPNNGVPAWGGISLSTRDMARFGMLVNSNGCWNDHQIVSNDWLEKSLTIESENGKADYGLHWWITKQPDGSPLAYAAGYGDQFVYVAPNKNIVIAINGQNFTDYKWPKTIDQLIKSIFSSIESP